MGSTIERTCGIVFDVLLLDNDDELSDSPDEEEAALAGALGESRLRDIDGMLLKHVGPRSSKVALVVLKSVEAGGFDIMDDNVVRLHLRRLIQLADAGAIEGFGNLQRPRFSEVCLPKEH